MVDTGWKPQGALGGMEWYAQSRERQQTSDLNQAKSWMDLNKTIEDVNDYLYERKERRLKSDVNAETSSGLLPRAREKASTGQDIAIATDQASLSLQEAIQKNGNMVNSIDAELASLGTQLEIAQHRGDKASYTSLLERRGALLRQRASVAEEMNNRSAQVQALTGAPSTSSQGPEGSVSPGYQEKARGPGKWPEEGGGGAGRTPKTQGVTNAWVSTQTASENILDTVLDGDASQLPLFNNAVANIANAIAPALSASGIDIPKEILGQTAMNHVKAALSRIQDKSERKAFIAAMSEESVALSSMGNPFGNIGARTSQYNNEFESLLAGIADGSASTEDVIMAAGKMAAADVVLGAITQHATGGNGTAAEAAARASAGYREANGFLTTLVEAEKQPWVTLKSFTKLPVDVSHALKDSKEQYRKGIRQGLVKLRTEALTDPETAEFYTAVVSGDVEARQMWSMEAKLNSLNRVFEDKGVGRLAYSAEDIYTIEFRTRQGIKGHVPGESIDSIIIKTLDPVKRKEYVEGVREKYPSSIIPRPNILSSPEEMAAQWNRVFGRRGEGAR